MLETLAPPRPSPSLVTQYEQQPQATSPEFYPSSTDFSLPQAPLETAELAQVTFSFQEPDPLQETTIEHSPQEGGFWSNFASELGTVSREIGTQLAAIGIAGTTMTAVADSATLGLGTALLVGGVVIKYFLQRKTREVYS
ncbi:MAG: hypothetical protein KDD55_08255 [Bdellovibrionales bacterium]|nr:hypothetical protein [Bdellovibrionales bacterium]